MEFETDVQQFFTFLNTFQGSTTFEKCSHDDSMLSKINLESVKLKQSLPVMIFTFADRGIVEDTFSLLMFYQQQASMNAGERERSRRTAVVLLKELLGFEFKQVDAIDITANENKIIKNVTEIENRIFEKIFAYLRPTKDSAAGANDEEGAATAVGETAIEEE